MCTLLLYLKVKIDKNERHAVYVQLLWETFYSGLFSECLEKLLMPIMSF